MRILSIETSADETAISIVEVTGEFPTATYTLLGNALRSQIEMHNQYGGIFPMMAKREHAKALVPILTIALTEAELLEEQGGEAALSEIVISKLREILNREDNLADDLLAFLSTYTFPEIDMIAVTSGPGLEPALWVGVSFVKALAYILNCPVIPVNHMEGHILAALFDVVEDDKLADIAFPAIALLISGGHTELVLMRDWIKYEKIGETRDDAVGEAFDKVARLMGLPYPGGPEIGKLAAEARTASLPPYKEKLPRPMITTPDFDFSFSGLKTAVRYSVEGETLSEINKQALARDFEEAVTDVLIKKASNAINTHSAKTLIIGGGVSANEFIRRSFETILLSTHPEVEIYCPKRGLSTDNSIMIALAGHAEMHTARTAGAIPLIRAEGNRSL